MTFLELSYTCLTNDKFFNHHYLFLHETILVF